jgi:4-hydroxy-3-methylbut-2-enyl diphosphate reductase IspH
MEDAKIYFFRHDGLCKYMSKIIRDDFSFFSEDINKNKSNKKYYIIEDWITKNGEKPKFLSESSYYSVRNIENLPEDAGVFNVAYDGNLEEINLLKKKDVEIIDKICPWMKHLKKELNSVPDDYLCIMLISESHVTLKNYQSIIPEKTMIIDYNNYKEKLGKIKIAQPIYLLSYPTIRKKELDEIINYIKNKFDNPENIFSTKSMCCWTKQGLLEEINNAVTEKNLNEIWIICSSKSDRSTISIANEVKEHNIEPIYIKEFEDIPKVKKQNSRIGVLIAPVPHKIAYFIKFAISKKYPEAII